MNVRCGKFSALYVRQIFYNTTFRYHYTIFTCFQYYKNCDISVATYSLKLLTSLTIAVQVHSKRPLSNLMLAEGIVRWNKFFTCFVLMINVFKCIVKHPQIKAQTTSY